MLQLLLLLLLIDVMLFKQVVWLCCRHLIGGQCVAAAATAAAIGRGTFYVLIHALELFGLLFDVFEYFGDELRGALFVELTRRLIYLLLGHFLARRLRLLLLLLLLLLLWGLGLCLRLLRGRLNLWHGRRRKRR